MKLLILTCLMAAALAMPVSTMEKSSILLLEMIHQLLIPDWLQ